jgi:hypothetical protein
MLAEEEQRSASSNKKCTLGKEGMVRVKEVDCTVTGDATVSHANLQMRQFQSFSYSQQSHAFVSPS